MTSLFLSTAIPDGFSSAAMMYKYIKMMDAEYPVHYMLHARNKSHGLDAQDFEIPDNTKLLIIPDAGTNDTTECNQLIESGMSVIILDHHEKNDSNIENKAIVVNNQTSPNYQNTDFCGAGVTYEFLRALDNYYWQEYADDFLDLVSFANISDSMDLRSIPTRYYVNKGLQNIQSSMLLAMIEAQDFSLKGIVNVHNVSWYITPIFNAMIRIGSMEERDLMFRAFIDDYYEFEYKKRSGEIIVESIYDRVARLCKNAKSRQDKLRDKMFEELKGDIDVNNKVIIIQTNDNDGGITGLSCMKIADTFQRPCILLRPSSDDGGITFTGSARNFDNSPVVNFKSAVEQTGLFSLAAGHQEAFGVQIDSSNLDKTIEAFNTVFKDINYDSSHICDFVLNVDELTIAFIREVDEAKWIWCTGIAEPIIAVENICIQRQDIILQGKNQDSVIFNIDGIKFVQFKLKDGDPIYDFINSWDTDPEDEICLNVVGTCSINNYNNVLEPQFIIDDCETIQN